jgi:hypothetical protein
VCTRFGGIFLRSGVLTLLFTRSYEPPEEQEASDHGENAESVAEDAVHVLWEPSSRLDRWTPYQRDRNDA